MKWIAIFPISLAISGCAVIAVADLAVTTAATAAKVGVKTVGAAIDVVTTGDKDKAKEDKTKDK